MVMQEEDTAIITISNVTDEEKEVSPVETKNHSTKAVLNHNNDSNDHSHVGLVSLPRWVDQLRPTWGERLVLPEWEDLHQRRKEGWQGYDLCHSIGSPVRILDYYYNASTVTGVVYFSHRAESHRGYCHGGSMCSVMDDILGWTAFLLAPNHHHHHHHHHQQQQQPKPKSWHGYTAQVNVSLKKPIPIHSILLLQGSIVKREGPRKVFVKAQLVNPAISSTTSTEPQSNGHSSSSTSSRGDFLVHAIGEGLVLLHKE